MMGPRKATMKGAGLYDAKSGKLIQDGLSTPKAREEYAKHHYIALPVVDKRGGEWLVEDKNVYCLHGSQYETVDGQRIHVAPCPECGGMGIRMNEPTVDTDCMRCTSCGYDFDCRLEMMES
jgi:hypothetical protein